MDNNLRRRNSLNMAYFKYGQTPANRKWLLATIITACIVLALITLMLCYGASMSMPTVLWVRGFTGIFAIVSIICAGVFYYRIYTEYWNDTNNNTL